MAPALLRNRALSSQLYLRSNFPLRHRRVRRDGGPELLLLLEGCHVLRRERELRVHAASPIRTWVQQRAPVDLVRLAAPCRHRLSPPEVTPEHVEPRRAPH